MQREARPISLRQLTFFGRTLTESRLLDSANYCRLELPTRLAHRLRDIQTLPYVVVANPHLAHVYESYLRAFERFRRVSPIATLDGVLATFTLAPNPARESLHLLTEQPTPYLVRTALGQVALQGTTAAGTTTIAVEKLAAGVYFFELHADTGRVVRRFVKE